MSKIQLKEFLNPINKTKEPIMDDPAMGEIFEKEYTPYIINKCLHPFMDTVLLVNEMNFYPFLDNKLQFDFYLYGLSKRSRFAKWIKASKIDNIEIVKEYYGYSNKRAEEALFILSEDDIKEMKQHLYKGGRK